MFCLHSSYVSYHIAGYATKDWAKMTLFHGSLFSKNTDRKLVESETWGHGSVYCQNLTKYYFLGSLISTEEVISLMTLQVHCYTYNSLASG